MLTLIFPSSDGDVVLGTEADLEKVRVTNEQHQARAFSIFDGLQKWPNGNLIYKFESQAVQTALGPRVDSAIARWTAPNQAPWMKFTRKTPGVAENGVLQITSVVNGGCNSVTGYSTGKLSMNLEPNDGGCPVEEIAHEIGHALGKHKSSAPSPTLI